MSTISLTFYESEDHEKYHKYDKITFARGYGLTDSLYEIDLPGWARIELGNSCLHWDRRVQLARATNTEHDVIILGHAIHLTENTSDLRTIALRLHQARANSRDAFLDELDPLCGRYIVLDRSTDECFVQSDAGALRSIYFNEGGSTIASHQNLISKVIETNKLSFAGTKEWKLNNRSWGYPGYKSHWDGVNFLPANHELNLRTGEFRRIHMRKPEQLTTAEVARQLLFFMRLQIPHLIRMGSPVVSLTAGQDSRTTLAALRDNLADFDFFTYALNYSRRARAVLLDKNVSRKLVDTFNIPNYKILDIDGPLDESNLDELLKNNSPKSSNRNVVARYLTEFPENNIHIRSSFYELGSARYEKQYGKRRIDADLLSEIFTYTRGYTNDTREAFDDYIKHSDLLKIEGYHPLDLFYWEMRMGSWLGTINSESDISFDTHILIGSRMIIRLLLSTPLSERQNGNTYHALVGLAWPELYDIPVNGELMKPIHI